MATVNCPNIECDFPLDLDSMEDNETFECPECGTELEVANDGTKLIAVIEADSDDFDEEEEEEED